MAVIRLDKVGGHQHLESIVAPVELTNGLFLQLGALVAGERELRTATVPSDVTGNDIVFHATPEVDPDPRNAGLKHFTVKAGENGRAYRLVEGNIVTLTEDLFDEIPVLNDIVAPQDGSMKLGVVLPADLIQPKLQFKVLEVTTLGYDSSRAFAVQVVKA